ncbi:MAG: hypothetical protein HKO12_03680 [Woeseiaceae bacterium]|nr:hypothetical protein [Woeseiaceae bacterium]
MTQRQQQTPSGLREGPINSLFGASIGNEESVVSVLDDAIPLRDASHADVAEYRVENPRRYAECFALLSDGRKVGLKDACQFVGWSRHDRDRSLLSLLFRSNGKHFEVSTEGDLRAHAPGRIRAVFLESESERRSSLARKFIGIDGDLLTLPAPPTSI